MMLLTVDAAARPFLEPCRQLLLLELTRRQLHESHRLMRCEVWPGRSSPFSSGTPCNPPWRPISSSWISSRTRRVSQSAHLLGELLQGVTETSVQSLSCFDDAGLKRRASVTLNHGLAPHLHPAARGDLMCGPRFDLGFISFAITQELNMRSMGRPTRMRSPTFARSWLRMAKRLANDVRPPHGRCFRLGEESSPTRARSTVTPTNGSMAQISDPNT